MTERRQVILDLITKTGGATAGLQKTSGQLSLLDKTAGKAKAGLGGLSVGATAAAAAAGVAVTGIIKSVQAFGEFDDKMTQSLAIMGDVSDAMRSDMSDAAREMAKNSTFSASEAAESYFFLASAGLDAEQSIAALPAVTNFAQAGMFDLATATDLVTDAQSALGLSVDEAGANLTNMTRVSDVLVKANTLANASVQQFSEALTNKLGASLRQYGIDVEEGTAALAVFADQGIKGAEAGEALGIVYRDLKRAATENASAFEEAGIAVFDQNGNFRNTADIIEDLTGAFGGLSVEQQTYLASQLGFQDRSFKNIQALLGQADALRSYESELRRAGGTTQDVADKQLESFGAQMDMAKSKLVDVGIGLGETSAPALLVFVNSLTDILEVSGPVLSFIGGFLAKIGEFSPIGLFAKAVNGIRSAFDETFASQQRFDKEMDNVRDHMDDGADGAKLYQRTLVALAEDGDLTTDRLNQVAQATKLSADEQVDATGVALNYARQTGQSASQVAILEMALRNAIAATEQDEDAKRAQAEAYGVVDHETERLIGRYGHLVSATEDAADGTDDYSGELDTLTGELNAARDAQESLTNVLKAAADPVFAAVDSLDSYQDALENLQEVQEDSEATAKELAAAELEVAKAALEAQADLDDLDPTSLNKAVESIGLALGKTKEEVVLLLQQLGILDGSQVAMILNVDAKLSGDSTAKALAANVLAGKSSVQQTGTILRFAGGGRPPVGEPSIIGEKGPELWVPDRPGTIIPHDQVTQMGGNTTTRNINVTFVNSTLANDPREGLRQAFTLDKLRNAAA